MKNTIILRTGRMLTMLFMAMVINIAAFAQENIEITTEEVGSWFERNWMWVAGAVLILLLIVIFSGSPSRSRTTTTVTDDYGNVKQVTTTEVSE